jgi:hypothetical protein
MKRHLMRMLIGTSVLVGGLISDVGVGAAQAQHFGGHRGGHGGHRGGHGRHWGGHGGYHGGHGRHWGGYGGYGGGDGGRGGYRGDDGFGQFIPPDFDSDQY